MTVTSTRSPRTEQDYTLEMAFRVEYGAGRIDANGNDVSPDSTVELLGKQVRVGDLRAMAIDELSNRVCNHDLLRRSDDTARMEALRFVERRIVAGQKVGLYDQRGSFGGFVRKMVTNLILDWIRSPAGRAELRKVEHDPTRGSPTDETFEITPPSEIFEEQREKTFHHIVTLRAIQSMPPGKSVILRLSLWPAYVFEPTDYAEISAFAFCHETAKTQADARGCDAGKRCVVPDEPWRTAYRTELDLAGEKEPEGLSRRAIAELTRIGVGKPLRKREGAVCERVSKARMQLVEALRRVGIRGAES